MKSPFYKTGFPEIKPEHQHMCSRRGGDEYEHRDRPRRVSESCSYSGCQGRYLEISYVVYFVVAFEVSSSIGQGPCFQTLAKAVAGGKVPDPCKCSRSPSHFFQNGFGFTRSSRQVLQRYWQLC